MIKHRKRFETWLPAYFDGEFEWDFLAAAFNGTKIMPMDFDAVVERRGHFLTFETKAKDKQIDKGQSITLTQAWKRNGFTILHVEGKTAPEITGYSVYSGWEEPKEGDVGDRQIKPGNSMDLLYVVRCWFCKASGEDAPTRNEWDNALWLMDYGGEFKKAG